MIKKLHTLVDEGKRKHVTLTTLGSGEEDEIRSDDGEKKRGKNVASLCVYVNLYPKRMV